MAAQDLWIFAAYTAVEHLEGPVIGFTPGRVDATEGTHPTFPPLFQSHFLGSCSPGDWHTGGDNCPPEDRLPEWDDTAAMVRETFGRFGLGDREIVALMGAHSVGAILDAFSAHMSSVLDVITLLITVVLDKM